MKQTLVLKGEFERARVDAWLAPRVQRPQTVWRGEGCTWR